MINHKKGLLALSPLLVFILLYLVTSIVSGDFYKVPITVAFMVASIFAIIMSGGFPLNKRIEIYSKGASTDNMMMMLWIFVLAGAFANAAKQMGSIDATVNMTLSVLPSNMLLAGLFLASCFISISIASSTGSSMPFVVAVVVGGSFFGDNLSFISDTTVVATRTQECKMADKFRVNFFIVAPAAFLILAAYVFMGWDVHTLSAPPSVSYYRIIPYMAVLICAVLGMNVMAVLTIGLILTGVIGIADGTYDIYGWFSSMGNGITGMGELIIITMMAGGLLEMIRANGGIDYIISIITRHVSSKRGAELTIAFLVSLVDICTANNTVAILTVGGISKQIGDKYGVDKRKAASILDTFSCCAQGLIPYGAQLLMAAGLAKINPVSIVPYLYYPFLIGVFALLSIFFRYPRRYS